jgi:hypothetical protein
MLEEVPAHRSIGWQPKGTFASTMGLTDKTVVEAHNAATTENRV